MRIYLSCQQSRRAHAIPAYDFWVRYFRRGLSEAGHEVVENPALDWAEGLLPLSPEARREWKTRTWTQAVDHLVRENRVRPVSVFLSYLYPDQVDPAALRAIRDAGIPTVNFFCDNIREFVRVPVDYHGFDLHWVPEFEARALYARAGLRVVPAPMPVWVEPSLRTIPERETEGAVFFGSHDELREDLLGDAVAAGLPLKLFGAGWTTVAGEPARRASLLRTAANQWEFLQRHGLRGVAMRETYRRRHRRPSDWIARILQKGSSSGEDYIRGMRESQVALGINRFPSFRHPFGRPHRYSRLRDIEAPMLGACYLTESAPGLDELFVPGDEIETYSNAGELVDKTTRLLADPGARRRLRQNGQRRALSEHTVGRSMEKIRVALGLSS